MKKWIITMLCGFWIAATVLGTAQADGNRIMDASEAFTQRDQNADIDIDISAVIILNGDTFSSDNQNVTADGNTIHISDEGIYQLCGDYHGTIAIDAGKNAKVQLVLDGVNIFSDTGPAISIQQADKVFITATHGSHNSLSNSSVTEDGEDAVIYSKSDLTLNGNGTLHIQSAGNGIVCKDSLVVYGGIYTIEAGGNAISGKDSIAISGAELTVQAGKDGIRAKNNNDAALGNVYIENGVYYIAAEEDGISATGWLQIDEGYFQITTGGGSEKGTMKASDAVGMWQRGGFQQIQNSEEDTIKAKGLKADGKILIVDGSFTLDCADDGVHADDDITICSGYWDIRSADDAIHSGNTLHIQGGEFTIPYCYEGLEGQAVTIDGGLFQIISTDDGINAAGGADASGGWGRPMVFGDENAFILINGGEITILSDGDSIDSNGTITFNGGTLDLTCNGNGNTAIDSETGFTNNGATVKTNDGSENGETMMFGRGGQRGQFGGWQQDSYDGPGPQWNERPDGHIPQGQRPEGEPPMNIGTRPENNEGLPYFFPGQ